VAAAPGCDAASFIVYAGSCWQDTVQPVASGGKVPVAEPVLLISSDSFLGPSLEAVARGRLRVARLDPSLRPVAWPAEPAATVVLDVTARQRDAFHAWVRRHHPGPMVVVLKPGERPPTLPRDLVVVGRPFRLVDLVTILEHPPDPPGPGVPAATPEPGQGPSPRRSGRGIAVRVLVGLLVLLVLVAALFAFGLLGGRRDLQDLLVSGALNLHG
jgi:hypothetical protein